MALLLIVSRSVGQNPTFTASVDQTTVGVNDQFEITFTLNGSGGGNNFRPPSFSDFQVAGGPNQSTNMQFINGTISSSVAYSYVLVARAEGKFTIGVASIEAGGKQLQTQPIAITVVKGAAPPPKSAQTPQQQQQQESADLGKQIDENLFVKVILDKSKVYQGEQITATYKLYNRTRLSNLSIGKVPALTGFWSDDIEDIKQVKFSQETIDGKRYDVAVLKKVALFPQRSGTLEVDPMEVTCVVQVQSRRRANDVFDQFFDNPFFGGFSNVNHTVKSQPMKVTVQPLPTTGVPEGFKGAVGKYQMEAWLDKKQVKSNDPVTLKVKISGTGNLKLLEAPAVVIPPDFDKYDPKISDNVTIQNDKIAGSRTFEYLLIPRHAGDQQIPSFPFSYFDPDQKKYVALRSPQFDVTIEKGVDAVSSVATGISKEDVKLLGEDIRFIKSENVSWSRRGETFVGSLSFYLLSMSPVVSFIGLVFVIRRRARVLGDVVSLRSRKARRMALRRLAMAKKFLEEKKREEFYAEISRTMWGYVGDKLAVPPSELSADRVRASLADRKIPEETISGYVAAIEQCEFARFAPSDNTLEMENMYKGAADLISKIEETL